MDQDRGVTVTSGGTVRGYFSGSGLVLLPNTSREHTRGRISHLEHTDVHARAHVSAHGDRKCQEARAPLDELVRGIVAPLHDRAKDSVLKTISGSLVLSTMSHHWIVSMLQSKGLWVIFTPPLRISEDKG